MRLSRAVVAVSALVVAAIAVVACPQTSAATPCNVDDDCRRDESCADGICTKEALDRDAGPGDGEGAAEGEGAASGEGEGAASGEGEGASTGEGEGASTGEGEGASTGEGEGASTGEGEGASTGEGEGAGTPDAGPVCGDGAVDVLGEQCDDGNRTDGDGCEANCTLPTCGNAILDVGEQCDDGNSTNGDNCDDNCTLPRCGNHALDPGEQCDDGNNVDADGCEANCMLPACGNAIVDVGEECDDGNTQDRDTCEGDCTAPRCNNAILDSGEECDDVNSDNSDGCDQCQRVPPALAGIAFRIFDGVFTSCADLENATPVISSNEAGIDISLRDGDANFGYIFDGNIFVPVVGNYTFFVTSDDGARLFVDGNLVVDGDGVHPPQEHLGAIAVGPGWHSFRLEYFNGPLGDTLNVEWQSDEAFTRRAVAPSDLAITP